MCNPSNSAAALLIALSLAGCASGVAPDAPSLLPRAIESRSDAEAAAPAAEATPDAAFDSRIAERVSAFSAAAKAFEAARPTLAAKIERARGAAEGSERWLDGQSAIGELQQARTASDGAMADLEELAIERASAGAVPYPSLEQAIAAAQTELNRQAEIEARLKATIGV